jgi:large subunit ribosomal protein L9
MKVILTQNVPHLGSLGDEVAVKGGYARNYLLPRGLALAPTGHNAREIQHRRRALEKSRAEAMAAARSEAEKLAELTVTLTAKAGASGRLFGSITNRDIQAALAELGIEVDRRAITLQEPIKTVGSYEVSVKLHTEVRANVDVRVNPIVEEGAVPPTEGEAAEGAAAAEGSEAAATEGVAEATTQGTAPMTDSPAEEAAAPEEPTPAS